MEARRQMERGEFMTLDRVASGRSTRDLWSIPATSSRKSSPVEWVYKTPDLAERSDAHYFVTFAVQPCFAAAEAAAIVANCYRFIESGTGGIVLVTAVHDLLCRPAAEQVGSFVASTGFSWVVEDCAEPDVKESEEPIRVPSDVVTEIRTAFGLNVADTARVLLVERPTVYSWLSGRSLPQEANLRRLSTIGRLARTWIEHSARPAGPLLKLPLGTAPSLFESLTRESLDERKLEGTIRSLAAQQRTAQPRSVRALAKERGHAPSVSGDQSHVIDALTGRRMETE